MLRALPAVVFAAAFVLPVWALQTPADMPCCPAGGSLACCLAPGGCVLRSFDESGSIPLPVSPSVFVLTSVETMREPDVSSSLPAAATRAVESFHPDLPDPPPRG